MRPIAAVVAMVGLLSLGIAVAAAQPPAAPLAAEGAKALFYGPSGATLRPDAPRPATPVGRPPARPTPAAAPAPQEYMGVTYWVELVEPNGQQRRVTADHVFRSGDRIRLSVQSNRDGTLALINLGSTGRATPLFPAVGQEASAAIRAHQIYQVPPSGHLRFDHNPGEETLLLILSAPPSPDGGSHGAAPPMTAALPGGMSPPPALPTPPPPSTALPGAGGPPPPAPLPALPPAADTPPPLPQPAGPPPGAAPQTVPAADAPLPFPQPGAPSTPSPQPAALPLPAPAADAPLPFPQPGAAAAPPAPGSPTPATAPGAPATAQGPQGAPARPAGTTQQAAEDVVRLIQEAMRRGAKDLVVETEQGGAQPASYAVAPLASVQGGGMITVQIKLRHR